MKKLIALILVLFMLAFAGCGAEKNSTQEDEINKETRNESLAADTEETEAEAEEESEEESAPQEEDVQKKETPSVKIEEGYLELIGKTSSQIAAIKGEMSENLWADGPLYRFGSENVWYGFENYDFGTDNSYIPLDECNSIGVPLRLLLKTDGTSNADALEAALGKVLIQGFDAMYETNTYSASYKNYTFVIYEASRESISADSMVNISIN